MVNANFVNFRAVYDELTDEVLRARYQFIPDHLRSWFRTLDETPGVRGLVLRLQNDLDFDQWYSDVRSTQGMWAGSASLTWPEETEKKLGMRLLLFRALANESLDIGQFGFTFIPSGANINDNARAVVEELFAPMARELRRYLEGRLLEAPSVPASDRVVRIDHNSAEYSTAIEALDNVTSAIEAANDYPDADDKDQRLAEVSATRRLLKPIQVRIAALVGLISPVLTYLASHFLGTAVGDAAEAAIKALEALFKMIF